MRRPKSLIVSGEKAQVLGLFEGNVLIDKARVSTLVKKSPETHPIAGNKNKEVAT